MTTFSILIGNSDNKLTQQEWSNYVSDVTELLMAWQPTVHFLGYPPSNAPWQNACWVIETDNATWLEDLKMDLADIAEKYKQDSIAVLQGETEFVKPKERRG